jgi:transposase
LVPSLFARQLLAVGFSFEGQRVPLLRPQGVFKPRVYSRKESLRQRVPSKEIRLFRRAVRMVREHGPEHPSQWAAITSIATKLGCTAETLRNWVRQAERDSGQRGGLTTDERQRLKELERDNRELRRANEILKKASAYFAQAELDRRPK